MTLRIREAPPMRLYMLATAPTGATYRWGEDEPGADKVFGSLVDSDTVPGGYKELQCSLPRKSKVDYSDMTMGTMLELFGSGKQKVGEYRLERAPRTSGDQLTMDPAAYGYQNHLSDDESAQEIFIDRELGGWGDPSTQRRINILAASSAGRRYSLSINVNSIPGSSSQGPAVSFQLSAVQEGTTPTGESWFYGGGVDIGSLLFDYRSISGDGADANYVDFAILSSDDLDTSTDVSGTYHQAPAVTAQELVASVAGRKYAVLTSTYGAALPGGTYHNETGYINPVVLGRHGLSIHGSWPEIGLLASDVIAYAISIWAPLLNFIAGPNGTIRPTSFVVPHLSFKDPGPISGWIAQANRFELNEWAVWNDRTFYVNPRGEREGRRRWVARTAPAHLQETGQQMERVWNGVIVEYQDVGGTTRSVGPPGARTTNTDEHLIDVDPLNVANQLGIKRYTKIATNGACTLAGAVRLGELFLQFSKELDGSGSATLTGYVEDDNGQLWPYYCVHAGDLIRFPDATHPGWRYIVNAQRTRADRSVQVDLDAPPDSMSALLERLDVVLVGL